MGRLRFSIASLMGVVVFAGAGIAALREATGLWDSTLFTASIAVLLVAALLVWHREGRGRTFWLGFALFGMSYLVLSLIPTVEPRLLTTRGLHYLDSKIRERVITLTLATSSAGSPTQGVMALTASTPTLTTGGQGTKLWYTATGQILTGSDASTENFVRIGHSLLSLILAFLGGWLSLALLSRRRRTGPDESPAVEPSPDAKAPAQES